MTTDNRRTDPEVMDGAIKRAEDKSAPQTEWAASNGIIFTIKRIPPTLLTDISSKMKRPEPPMVTNPTTERTEPNPDDPAFKEALEQWAFDQSMAVFSAAVIFGLKVKHLPEGFHPPESDEWIDELETVLDAVTTEENRIQIAREPKGLRFWHWVRYYALQDDVDLFAVSRMLTARTALTEKEVHDAVDAFRRVVVGFPDLIGTVTGWVENSDPDLLSAIGSGDGLGI